MYISNTRAMSYCRALFCKWLMYMSNTRAMSYCKALLRKWLMYMSNTRVMSSCRALLRKWLMYMSNTRFMSYCRALLGTWLMYMSNTRAMSYCRALLGTWLMYTSKTRAMSSCRALLRKWLMYMSNTRVMSSCRALLGTWLMYMSNTRVMSHSFSCVLPTYMSHVSLIYASRFWLIHMSHVSLIWIRDTIIRESCLTHMSHMDTWVMSHSYGCPTWPYVGHDSLIWLSNHVYSWHTGCQRCIWCLKLQVSFRKRATNHKALLRKMTYKDICDTHLRTDTIGPVMCQCDMSLKFSNLFWAQWVVSHWADVVLFKPSVSLKFVPSAWFKFVPSAWLEFSRRMPYLYRYIFQKSLMISGTFAL